MQYIFHNWQNTFPLLLTIRQITISFMAFDFVILSDSNSNCDNLVETLFFKGFLVDYLICQNFSWAALKTWKSFLSGLILINLQPSSCFIAFCLFISLSIFSLLCPLSSTLLQAYSHENTSQSYNLKHCLEFAYFLLQMNLLFLLSLNVILLKWHHFV